jgi:hypothetical protein
LESSIVVGGIYIGKEGDAGQFDGHGQVGVAGDEVAAALVALDGAELVE